MRPSSLDGPIFILLGLALNLVVLLAPVLSTGWTRPGWGADVGLFLLGASALCLADLAGVRHQQPPEPVPTHDVRVVRLAWGQGLAVLAIFWLGLGQRLDGHGETLFAVQLRLVGFVLMVGGTLLRHAAIRCLGPHFVTEIRVGPQLVRRGVYGRIRHPSETGLVLSTAGAGVLLSSPLALVIFLFALLPIVVVRTRLEDAALASAFGDDHARYRSEAGRFFPVLRKKQQMAPNGAYR